MAKVEITTGVRGGTVRLDGHDISGAIRGLRLDSTIHGSVLTLDVVAHEVEVDGDARVYIAPEARELLVSLGWTPPEAADAANALHRPQSAPDSGGETP